MDVKKKGNPVPEPAEVQAPDARRPLRPVVRAMVPIGLAAGLSVAGIAMWVTAEPQACERPGEISPKGPSTPFEVVRLAWQKVRTTIMPKPVASPAGAIPVAPPIAPATTAALAGEPPPVVLPPPSASSTARKPSPKLEPTHPLPHVSGGKGG